MTKTKTRLISAVIAVLVVAAALFLLLPTVLSTTASGEVWSGQAADSFATGDGTEANPYQIKTAEELALLAKKVNAGETSYASAYYRLTADIVLNESLEDTPNEWTAIGTDATPFTGKFSGDGHTISGIVINKSDEDYQGLFGYSTGTIMNVGVINSSISGSWYVGGVCGINDGTITNCYSTGAVSGSWYVGGICGENYGTIENCYSTGTVSGTGGFVGGVCGLNTGTIENCYSTGAVSGLDYSVGGVCGYDNYGTITNCYYDTDFCSVGGIDGSDVDGSATGISTAALCGSTLPTGFDSGVWTVGSAGDVTKTEGNHGKKTYTLPSLNGVGLAATYEEKYYNFGTNGSDDWQTYTEISTAEELQNINNNLGGNYVLTANITLTAPAAGSSNWTAIGTSPNPFTGKFDGDGHTISGIVINKSGENYQGLFGCSAGTIMNVGVINSSISGGDFVGGVCGQNNYGTIKNCYSTGAVRGTNDYVGGVCGENMFGSTIKNCYSTGEVSGSTDVGGVCGKNNATVENCYSAGAVRGAGNNVGGVCGRGEYGTIKNCYYDTDFHTKNAIGNNNQGTANNVTGKTTTALCGSLPAGFDSAVWTAGSFTIDPEDGKKATATFPQLKVFENTSAPTTTLSLYNFGTDEAPKWDTYTEISTAEELKALSNDSTKWSGNYVLTANITLTAPAEGGSNWTAIGTPSNHFTGKFSGDGHTISGIVINSTADYQGLFGYLGQIGTIMNVGVIDSSISGGNLVGGVCGYSDLSTITNCYSTGEVSGKSKVGGVCGQNDGGGTITNCYSTGEVSGDYSVGGVCGQNDYTIENCYYLEGCNAVGTSFSCNEGTSKTETQFKNGSVCYLLNGSTSTNPVWYQLLETENYPNLDSKNSANRTVYQCTPCTVVFSNTEGQTAEHSCVVGTKHICEKCEDRHDAVFTADDTADTISICHGFGTVTLKAPTENLTYDGTAKAATVEGELTGFDTPKILYKLKDSAEAAVETAPINAGTYVASITYTISETNYSVSVEYTIGKAELTVEADTYKVSKVYDGTTNEGTGSGEFKVNGLVGEDSVTISVDSIGKYTSADVGASNVTVTISLTDASGNYTLGNTTVSVPAEITAKAITPTVEGSGTHTYTGSAITPNVTVKDGTTVLVKDKDYTITVTNNINAGVATVTITAKSGGNYTFSERTLNFQIFKATPNVTAPTAKTGLVYNGTAKELISAGSTNFGTLVYSLNENGEYSTAIPKGTNAGTYTVYYKVQGDSNVYDTAANTVAVSIGKAAVTITANSYTVKVDEHLPTFEYKVSGLVNNEALPIEVNVSCTAADSSTEGTYPITVSGAAESTNYAFTYMNGNLIITKKEIQTITADDVTLTYGNAGKKITAATSGDGALSYEVKTGEDVIDVAEDGTITAKKAGTATVEIKAEETTTYAKTSKTVAVTVSKAAVTIKANSYSVYVGDELPTFGYTVTGLASGDSLNFTPVLSCAAADTSTAGTYTITVKINVAEDDKYIYTAQNGTLTVKKKSSGGSSGGTGGSGGSSGGGSYRPTTPTTTNPSIGGSAKSWSDVAADLGKLTSSSEATIELNGSNSVPVDVIKAISDKGSKVTLVIDSVFSWAVDGAEITNPAAADL
ncbi:MAG: hypothetical protein MSR67_09985, partial [Oscillospiraceae bacterium]|nr:hypothetical protein [Oscillospiraceae bacterium]